MECKVKKFYRKRDRDFDKNICLEVQFYWIIMTEIMKQIPHFRIPKKPNFL